MSIVNELLNDNLERLFKTEKKQSKRCQNAKVLIEDFAVVGFNSFGVNLLD